MLPPTDPERPFVEPWHAQIFGMTHALAASGTFTWPDWAAHFGTALAVVQKAGGPTDGSDYYDVWLVALETFLIEQDHADQQSLDDLHAAWTDAYLSTPHGAPVELNNGELNGGELNNGALSGTS
ncbi:MAG: nitrile hydratase accessory protein [Alphaproteobacteria bacterium]|nr:nitrile hydratase accessory protein [Alphaproteobacteria bacterium]